MMVKTPNSPVPNILTAAGNINQHYEPLGLVFAVVSREQDGCTGTLPVGQAIIDATNDLKRQAVARGGNGVLHISYMHRVSTSTGCGNTKSNFEVYAWGTAARL